MGRRRVLEEEETGEKRGGAAKKTWKQILRFLSAYLQVVMNILKDGCVQDLVYLDEPTVSYLVGQL